MTFKKISLIEISSSVVGLGVVVTLACLHAGVWSLVAGSLTSAAISSILLCGYVRLATELTFLVDGSPVRDELWAEPFRLQPIQLLCAQFRQRDCGALSWQRSPWLLPTRVQHHDVSRSGNRTGAGSRIVSGVFRDSTRQRKVSSGLLANLLVYRTDHVSIDGRQRQSWPNRSLRQCMGLDGRT